MIRPTRCFRPSLDEFDKKLLLSAGQIAPLAHAEPAVDTFKFYFRLKNSTGHNLKVEWNVSSIASDSGKPDIKKGDTIKIVSRPLEGGGVATVTVKYDGKTIYPSFDSRRNGEREPAQIPLTDLT